MQRYYLYSYRNIPLLRVVTNIRPMQIRVYGDMLGVARTISDLLNVKFRISLVFKV